MKSVKRRVHDSSSKLVSGGVTSVTLSLKIPRRLGELRAVDFAPSPLIVETVENVSSTRHLPNPEI